MLGRIPAARQAIIDRIAAAARRGHRRGMPVAPDRLARYFYHGVSELDLVQRTDADLAGAALAQLALGRVRRPGRSLVRVFNPDAARDGFESSHTVIMVITDDMPFLVDSLGMSGRGLHVGAVCVYHNLVPTAVDALAGSGVPVAAVSTGFPAGQTPLDLKIEEVRRSVAAGATEIDIVVSRAHVLTGDWRALFDEVRAFREACGPAHMKTIVAAGELGTLRNLALASHVCMMAGADFIKTSTGKEPVNATLPFGLVMVRAVRDYHERTGHRVGFKPAGGIRTAKQALDWLILMKEELGAEWLSPSLFRIGASALLTDIERQLEHFVTGRYSAAHHHPMV